MNWIKRKLLAKELAYFEERERMWQRYYNVSQRDLNILMYGSFLLMAIIVLLVSKRKS